MSDTEIAEAHLQAALDALNDARRKLEKKRDENAYSEFYRHLREAGTFITTARHYDPAAVLTKDYVRMDADFLASQALYYEALLLNCRGAHDFELTNALKAINKAIEYAPHRTSFYVTKAEILIRQQRRNEAIALLNDVISTHPDKVDAIRLLNRLVDQPTIGTGDPLPSTHTAASVASLRFFLFPAIIAPFFGHVGIVISAFSWMIFFGAVVWDKWYDSIDQQQQKSIAEYGKKDFEL